MIRHFLTALLTIFFLSGSQNIFAIESEGQIIEAAREKARQYEKLKKILVEDPDQNVRLATFDLMIRNDDTTMREIALDVGLSSADVLLQSAAFKEAIMGMDNLHLIVAVDDNTSMKMQEECGKLITKWGKTKVIELRGKDREKGTFSSHHAKGQILGRRLTFTVNSTSATLELVDNNALEGSVSFRGKTDCLMTGKFR